MLFYHTYAIVDVKKVKTNMSEKMNSNSYLLPAEFMEPQRPITPEGYNVTSRENIQDAGLRSIPDALTPVYLVSATSETVVKGGEGSEFRKSQDVAYAEREKNRNEWIERELGGVAIEATVTIPVSVEVSDISSLEQESRQEAGMDIVLVEDVVRTLKYANESNRDIPEAEGRRSLNAHIIKKANGAYDELKGDKISAESYSVMASTLLGAASSRDSIDEVVGMLMESETLDADTKADLSAHANAIKEIASLTGMDGELARIKLANSLIARSELLLQNNNNVATSRYRTMVGFSAGLSTQIKDPSYSSGFVQGALGKLKKHS